MEKIMKDSEIMTIENIEDIHKQVKNQFKLKRQVLEQYEAEITELDSEIETLKEARDTEFKTANKEVEIILSALMALALLLTQLSFFAYAYPRCLTIADITMQTLAAMLGVVTEVIITIGGIKICNKIVTKGLEAHAQNMLKSKEYQQLNQKVLDKEAEKEQKANEASKIRKETLILALNDCKCLIASINQKEAKQATQTIENGEPQEAITQSVPKPIRKIRTINRRN